MRTLIVVVAATVALAGCGHKKRARVTPPRTPRTPAVVQPGHTEKGIARWYGHPYHGRAAANGEIYDMEKMTAAHRTLPFNTWVRVYDLDNNRTTEVRITDRGPFVGGRIIDLSHAAARELEMIGPGVARVRIEVIRPPPDTAPPHASGRCAPRGGRAGASKCPPRPQPPPRRTPPRGCSRCRWAPSATAPTRSGCAAGWRRATAQRGWSSEEGIPRGGGC